MPAQAAKRAGSHVVVHQLEWAALQLGGEALFQWMWRLVRASRVVSMATMAHQTTMGQAAFQMGGEALQLAMAAHQTWEDQALFQLGGEALFQSTTVGREALSQSTTVGREALFQSTTMGREAPFQSATLGREALFQSLAVQSGIREAMVQSMYQMAGRTVRWEAFSKIRGGPRIEGVERGRG